MAESEWRLEWAKRVQGASAMPRPTHRDHYRAVLVSVRTILAADAALQKAEAQAAEGRRLVAEWRDKCVRLEVERDHLAADLKAAEAAVKAKHCAIHEGVGALEMQACPECFVGLREDLRKAERERDELRRRLDETELAAMSRLQPWIEL